MAENRRGKDNRFYFSRGQMVLLGGAFTLTAAMVFFLGIFVGKSIEESKATKREEPLIKIPINPTTQGAAGAATVPPKDEITFNDSVSKSEGSQPACVGSSFDLVFSAIPDPAGNIWLPECCLRKSMGHLVKQC